jgi:hypothetical protein
VRVDSDLVIVASTIVALAGMAYSLVRSWIQRAHVGRRELQSIEDRLTRIEQAVDSIAIEVERVSEGQRFSTKLLADRSAERVDR